MGEGPTEGDRPPSLAEDVSTLRTYTASLRKDLLRPAAGMLRLPYLSAGAGATYPDLTDWDAVWAGAAYLIDGDAEPLRSSLLNLLDHIGPDGKGQRRIGAEGYNAPAFQLRPFLAAGCFVLARETDDVTWLGTRGLARLDAYLRYRHERGTGAQGLLTWRHVDEGFADNGLANWAWEEHAVQAADLNAQLVLEHAATSWLADRLGDAEMSARHADYARTLAERIEQFLWDETDGCYYSRYVPPARHERSRPIRCQQYVNLWPLFYGLAAPERARRVIDRYVLAPEHYWGPWGIRSLSAAEDHFNNARRSITQPMNAANLRGPALGSAISSNWQGPVWSVANYLVAGALARYGYRDEAAQLARTSVRLHAAGVRRDGCFHENYHSETGEPLAAPGIGSWCVMVQHLPEHVRSPQSWWTRGLSLPGN
ncbi:MGH1-like glycoside hydrolase domain-containing protein [Ruania alba]|uniref:Trehalase n=1 Tax=Ruania alba TaxID=648782 RepID=A0A1H5N9C5_9MICO|nr:trehalase family glycosidase [Ruania alba]SEE97467.1 Trehalase [Ruania alba]